MKTRADTGEAESRYGRSRSVASVRHGQVLLLRIFLFIFFFALFLVFLVFGEKVVRKWRGARWMAEGGMDDGCGLREDARAREELAMCGSLLI